MKTHSIILSTDMVEAILAGRKTKLWELFSPRPAFNAELDHVDDLVYAEEKSPITWHEPVIFPHADLSWTADS